MARIKKEAEEQIYDSVNITAISNEIVTVNTDLEETTTIDSNQKEMINSEIKESNDIPEYVDQILKMYPNYEKLYIDNKKGVYTSDHNKSIESKLYTNPYHKK